MKRIFYGEHQMILSKLVISMTVIFAGQRAFAVNEWFEFYNNTRSLAMGGASIAITSDDTSLYRNPASLGSLRDMYGSILDPEVEGTENLTASQIDIKGTMESLSTKPDTFYRNKTQITPTLVRRNIGLGLIYKNEISAEITSASPNTMDTAYRSDIGGILGANIRLFDGRIKIGAAGRVFNRIELIDPALSTAGPTDLPTIAAEGTAYTWDAGILLQAPWDLIPTLGVVVRDIGDTKFVKDSFRISTAARPQEIKQSVDAALAIFPIHSNMVRSVWTVEYSDITNSRNDTDNAKRVHVGVEFNTRDIFFLRLGYNQRYVTGGFEIASEYWAWQVATYGEEIGTEADPREDRRLNMKLSLRF
ncbi:MAG: hypothetical protein K0R29_1283 [Pseudobdellovibrio sp.]|jgi:hypothetical protein|nr:hypothetical protein [Pseudobdellovibrio sp.]